MQRYPFLIILIFLLVLAGCGENKQRPKVDVELEVVDFFSYPVVRSESVPTELIKSKEYIKLDNSDDDFLFSRIDKIKIIDDRIFIQDRRLKKYLFLTVAVRE